MASRLEQLDRVAVRIFNLNLFAARTNLHLVSKTQTRLSQLTDARRQVLHLKQNAVPSAGLLLAAVRQWAGPRRPGPLKINLRPPIDTWPNAGTFCMSRLKPSVCV